MGGGTTSYKEIEETDAIILWGSNARETHPIFFHHVLKGVHNGARLFVVDPRRTTSADGLRPTRMRCAKSGPHTPTTSTSRRCPLTR